MACSLTTGPKPILLASSVMPPFEPPRFYPFFNFQLLLGAVPDHQFLKIPPCSELQW